MNFLFFISQEIVQKSINSILSKLLKLRNRHFFILDVIVFSMTPLLALLLHLDSHLYLQADISELALTTILFVVVKLIVFWTCGFYRRYWRYASIEELTYIAMLMLGAVFTQIMLFEAIHYIPYFSVATLPQSLPLIDGLLSCIVIGVCVSVFGFWKELVKDKQYLNHRSGC